MKKVVSLKNPSHQVKSINTLIFFCNLRDRTYNVAYLFQITGKKLLTTTLKLGGKAIQKQKLLATALVQNSLNPDLKKFIMKLAHLPKQKE